MKAIVAVDMNWGIGYKGNLLVRIPEDMRYFKEKTLGKVVIMGRETFMSLPGKEPLKDRINIVLSRNWQSENADLKVCHSFDELFQELEKYNKDEIFVIGGESIYKQLLPYCSEVLVTKIMNCYEADKYFINLDNESGWSKEYESEIKDHKGIKFSFQKYYNNNLQNVK